MNGMGIDNQSKHKLMIDVVTMMMASFTSTEDADNSDDEDDKEKLLLSLLQLILFFKLYNKIPQHQWNKVMKMMILKVICANNV